MVLLLLLLFVVSSSSSSSGSESGVSKERGRGERLRLPQGRRRRRRRRRQRVREPHPGQGDHPERQAPLQDAAAAARRQVAVAAPAQVELLERLELGQPARQRRQLHVPAQLQLPEPLQGPPRLRDGVEPHGPGPEVVLDGDGQLLEAGEPPQLGQRVALEPRVDVVDAQHFQTGAAGHHAERAAAEPGENVAAVRDAQLLERRLTDPSSRPTCPSENVCFCCRLTKSPSSDQ